MNEFYSLCSSPLFMAKIVLRNSLLQMGIWYYNSPQSSRFIGYFIYLYIKTHKKFNVIHKKHIEKHKIFDILALKRVALKDSIINN